MNVDSQRHSRDIQAAPALKSSTAQAGPLPVKVVLALISTVIVVLAGVGHFTVGRLGGDLSSASNLGLGENGDKGLDGAVDILLVGSDSRTDAQGNPLSEEERAKLNAGNTEEVNNTDTIMVVRVPNDGSRASAVSIPRDTYVNDGDFGNMKINAVSTKHHLAKADELETEREQQRANGVPEDQLLSDEEISQQATQAGRSALLEQVRTLTGVEIDHYAEVGLLGFVLLTEAVGGVEVCLNEAVDDPMSGAKFPAGRQTLHGAEALSFVRQRYGLPRGDLDRIVRQQVFMASLVNKALSTDTLTSPQKLSEISNAVERSVVIDENWDVMGFAMQLANLAGGNVTFNTIPVTSVDGVGDYGESIVTVDIDEVHKFMENLAKTDEETPGEGAPAPAPEEGAGDAEESLPPVPDDLTVHVLNAGTTDGLASGIGAWLQAKGYNIAETANAQEGIYSESQVVAADPEDPEVKALAERLGGLPITTNTGLEGKLYIVVATDDYAGPRDDQAMESGGIANVADAVGSPGADFGEAEISPEITAGGDGPRCVN